MHFTSTYVDILFYMVISYLKMNFKIKYIAIIKNWLKLANNTSKNREIWSSSSRLCDIVIARLQ